MKWSVFTLSDIRRVRPRMNALYKTTNDSFTRLLRFQEFYNVEISKSRSVNLEKNSPNCSSLLFAITANLPYRQQSSFLWNLSNPPNDYQYVSFFLRAILYDP